MSRTLTAQDRASLIRLASSLPAGSAERKALLASLQKLPIMKNEEGYLPSFNFQPGRKPGTYTVLEIRGQNARATGIVHAADVPASRMQAVAEEFFEKVSQGVPPRDPVPSLKGALALADKGKGKVISVSYGAYQWQIKPNWQVRSPIPEDKLTY